MYEVPKANQVERRTQHVRLAVPDRRRTRPRDALVILSPIYSPRDLWCPRCFVDPGQACRGVAVAYGFHIEREREMREHNKMLSTKRALVQDLVIPVSYIIEEDPV